jgi:PKD repeat protein
LVPLAGCGDSAVAMSVVVKNFGLNTITSLPISVAITGGITTTVNTTATVNIPVGATDTIAAGTFNSYAGAAGVNFMATVALAGDQKSSNDSLAKGPGTYIPFEPLTSGVVDTVCANGDSVDLYATYIPGTRYAWYDMLTGGTKLANGDTLRVPSNGPTTYYVAYDSATANPQVGTGTSVSPSTNITPYKSFWMDGRSQYLILASEMAALGVVGGGEINSVAFDVVSASAQQLTDFTIKMGGTSVTAMTSAFQPTTGMITCYSANTTTSTGWNVHTFTTPFIWNGVDNILIEVCYDNNAYTTNSSVTYSTTSFQSVTDGYADLGTSSGCTPGGITNQVVGSFRPNMQLNMKTIACSNIRKPVMFAVNPNTAVAAYSFTVQPNGADVDFNAGASVGDTYDWIFGDGNVGTGMTVTHTYATAGTYTACLIVTDSVCNSVDSVCQTVIASVGLEEGLIGQSLNLYPNPNDGKFRVEFQVEGLKNVEIRVMSLLGEVLYSNKPGNVSGTYREEIDLSNNAAGVYILQILSEDGTVSRRVTVRK